MKNKDDKIYEVSIKLRNNSQGQGELVKNLILSLRIKRDKIIEFNSNKLFVLSVYFNDRIKGRNFLKRFQKLHIKHVKIEIKTLQRKDWQTLWKQDYKPIPVTKRCTIVPAWEKNKYKFKYKQPIYIDSSFAFGTGSHATTRLMAQLIEQIENKFKTFLDIGTGTGILTVLGVIYGATYCEAIDLTRQIISVTKDNFRDNQIPLSYARAVNFEKYKSSMKFDCVVANLITHDLIKFKKKIVGLVKNGGYLAISGISVDNYELLRSAFKSMPLKCQTILKSEGWKALLFKKK